MKKLLTIAVVACVATFAQALTINWTSNTTIPFEVTADTDVTLVYSSAKDNLADVYANIASYMTVPDVTTNFIDMEDGLAGLLALAPLPGKTDPTLPEASSTYYVFCDNGDGYVYGASFDATAEDWKGNTVGNESAASFTATLNFAQVAVPEPTALALLALGVAGVALRRRRRA